MNFNSYHWDHLVEWGMTLAQLTRLFQENIARKDSRHNSFLTYFDLISPAHATASAGSHYYLKEPVTIAPCSYKALLSLDSDERLVQVTLTSGDRQCACLNAEKAAMTDLYGDPTTVTDETLGAVHEMSFIWNTESSVITLNHAVTSLGKSCNIIYRQRQKINP